MKLPNAGQAVVPSDKITDYLLSLIHPDGRDKAVFFMAFGFSPETPTQFEDSLLQQAVSQEVVKSVSNVFGVRYVVEGQLETPDGRNPRVRSVWFIAIDEISPGWSQLIHCEGSMMIKEHERVVLTVDLPDYQLQTGDIGTVVMIHQGGKGYEVEFFTVNGKMFDVVTVEAAQVRAVNNNELLHARPMQESA